MAADQRAPLRVKTAHQRAPLRMRTARLLGGGVVGNERLTAAAGVVLIVLLGVIGLTLLRLRALISVHLFVGLLLIPPVLLKLASTGYRFARYYTSSPRYRERGAPPALLRTTAPVVVFSTLGVFATGVALLLVGPGSGGMLRGLHKASFILWVGFTGVHVLGHLPDLPRMFLGRRGDGTLAFNTHSSGSWGRGISLAGALVAGAVLGVLLIPHFGGWVHMEHVLRDR